MKKPRWKESQNFFERRTLMHHQDWKRFFHKKLADRHNLLLKLKILLHQLVLCCGQSLRSFCSNSFCGKTQGNCRTGPGGPILIPVHSRLGNRHCPATRRLSSPKS